MAETIPLHRSSQWYCLLWKGFMQVRPTLIAVLCGGLAMQLLLLVAERWLSDAHEVAPMIACIAPILFAIGACGMLVGHERESGSWEWSSSLPVSWRSALTSKLLVTIACAIVTGAVLAVIPVVLLLAGRLVVDNASLVVVYLSGMTIIALLEVIAYFFLASLLMRETLTALVIAGLGLCIAQLAIPAMSLSIASDRLVHWGLTPKLANFLISFVSSLGIMAIGLAAMVVVFRWRWTIGQRTVFGMRASASATTAAVPSAAYVYSTTEGPDAWRALIRLAIASSFWLRVGAVALVSLALASSAFWNLWSLTIIPLVLGASMLGLSTFEGDQAHQRYRFLADRGIAPWKLVVSRLGVATAWMLGLWCILAYCAVTYALHEWIDEWILISEICVLAFLVSALAAICFRNPVVAATVAMVAFIGGMIVYGLAMNYYIEHSAHLGLSFHHEPWVNATLTLTLVCSPLAKLVLLAAIFRVARRWIVYDGLHLPRYFMAAVLSALILPIVGVFITLYTSLLASHWPQL